MNKEVTIYAGAVKALETGIKRLNRHAAKHGYSACTVVSIGPVREAKRTVWTSFEGETRSSSYAVSVRDVVLDLPEQFISPAAAEWVVLGLVHWADGEVEVSALPENHKAVDVASKGFAWKCCTCGHKLRKAFAVRRTATGETSLVGSECLAQYTGADGSAILSAIEFLAVIEVRDSDGDGGSEGGSHRRLEVIDLSTFIAACQAVAKVGGYLKRWETDTYGERKENINCTRNCALAFLTGFKASGKEFDRDALAVAEAQIEAWRTCYVAQRKNPHGFDPEFVPDEYTTQCQDLCERGWITEKSAGLAASLIRTPPQAPADKSGCVYLGTVGKREVFENLTCCKAIIRDGEFGISTIYKFEDAALNELTWFASGSGQIAEGEVVTLKATVKAHEEFRNVKQTIISRAKVVETVETKQEVVA